MKLTKLSLITAACLTLCSSASFAAAAKTTAPVCTHVATGSVGSSAYISAAQNFVNTCVFTTFYVAGSSALKPALLNVVSTPNAPTTAANTSALFDTTQAIYVVKDTGSSNGAGSQNTVNGGGAADYAFAGMSIASLTGDKSVPLFVVYNTQNGSAAGVSQLLSTVKDSSIPEYSVVTIGVGSTGVANTAGSCTTASAANTVNCTTFAATMPAMAISDVRPIELYQLEGTNAAKYKLSSIKASPVAIQGMGIAVNAAFYAALQTAQNTSGQPSITRADYASLIASNGAIKSAAGFIANDTHRLVLSRRDNYSGTQAASNMFFADNSCGNSTLGGKDIAGVLGGELNITDASANNDNVLKVNLNATGNGVLADLAGASVSGIAPGATASDYVIGVISLATADNKGGSGWHFVAIDGVSPTISTAGVADAKQRAAVASGSYAFAMESTVVYPVATVNKGSTMQTYNLINAVYQGLSNSAVNITGLAYLDGGSTVGTQSLVQRTSGNNCSPLIKPLTPVTLAL